jgi:hypothetical protein
MNPDPELLARHVEHNRKLRAWEHSADAARLGARWEPSRAAVRQGKSHTDREWRRQLRRRPTCHPVRDKVVVGVLIWGALSFASFATYLPLPLTVVAWGLTVWAFVATWRVYRGQSDPADGKPAVPRVHLPLLVRLFLLPGMVHVVGLPAVTKARHIRTIRRERARRDQAAIGYRIDVLEAELAAETAPPPTVEAAPEPPTIQAATDAIVQAHRVPGAQLGHDCERDGHIVAWGQLGCRMCQQPIP